MKTIQDHKKDATLNKVFRYNEGVMTRLEWLKMMYVRGATVREETKRNYAAEEKLQQWIYDNRNDNSGNPNWPATKNWLSKKEELKAGIFKTVYYLQEKGQNSFIEITKTEYDRFKMFELEEDIATQKYNLQNSIEAGIATDKEVEEDMQTDLSFFHKYAN